MNTSDPSGEYTASFQGFVVEGAEQRKAALFAEIRSRKKPKRGRLPNSSQRIGPPRKPR